MAQLYRLRTRFYR